MPQPKEKKYLPQLIKVLNVDRENYTIRFVFSTDRIDRSGEIIDQRGWKLDNYLKNPVVLWGHDQSRFPIGRAANMTNNGQLEGDVIFAYKENPEAATAFELIAGGFLNAGSVGFMNLKWMYDEVNDTLTLLENELYEFSIVNVPANPDALAKAVTDLESKAVDKRVIEKVKEMRDNAKQAAADRFKGLGEEVEPEGDGSAEDTDPEKKQPEVGAEEETTPEPETQTETPAAEVENPAPEEVEPQDTTPGTAEEAAKALETLLKSDKGTINAAVRELSKRLDAAQTKQHGSSVAGQKKISVTQLNRVIKNLITSKEKIK